MKYKAKHLFAVATIFSISACSQNIEVHQPKPPIFLNVSYIGNGDFTQRVLYSGIDTTLETALNNIIPLDWGVGISSDVKCMKTSVSWDSDQPWINALGNVVRVSGVYAIVDFERRYVEIKKSIPKPTEVRTARNPGAVSTHQDGAILSEIKKSVPKSSEVRTARNPGAVSTHQDGAILSGISQQKPTVSAFHITAELVKPKPKPIMVWEAKSGVKLSDNINQWATRAGWRVVWEGADYNIEVPFELKGEFLNVIKETMELYKKADQPLKASSFPSQTLIVVSNKNNKV